MGMESPNNDLTLGEKKSISEEEVAKFKNATKEEIEVAHDEANMLKAEAGGGSMPIGEMHYGGKGASYAHKEYAFEYDTNRIRPITTEEYDKANQIIKELETTIDDKAGIKKVLSKVAYGSWAILLIASDIPNVLIGGLKDPTETFKEIMSRETLNKTKAKLERMRKEGEEYGKESSKEKDRYGVGDGKRSEQG